MVFWICIGLLAAASPVLAQGEPKTVYIRVWNANGTDYPTGTTGDNGLTFLCHLEDANNGWTASEPHTQADEGFDYLVQGGFYPNHSVHHISVQCANFTAFQWEAGDRLVVQATDVEAPFADQSNSYTLIVDSAGEQFADPDFALPVVLSSFTAIAGDAEITLRWTTESELNTLGFHVYRALHKEGPYERITTERIAGAGTSTMPRTYTFTDIRLRNGLVYYYKIEDVSLDGVRELHGPACAKPMPPIVRSRWGAIKVLLK